MNVLTVVLELAQTELWRCSHTSCNAGQNGTIFRGMPHELSAFRL